VQQAALARVKWLREDARRMDSTMGGLIWIWPTSGNKQSTLPSLRCAAIKEMADSE
jgi:hypothetical protein